MKRLGPHVHHACVFAATERADGFLACCLITMKWRGKLLEMIRPSDKWKGYGYERIMVTSLSLAERATRSELDVPFTEKFKPTANGGTRRGRLCFLPSVLTADTRNTCSLEATVRSSFLQMRYME